MKQRTYNSKDYDYIDEFKKITLKNICEKYHIHHSNLYTHRMKPEYVHWIRVELENQVRKLNNYNIRNRKIRSKKKRIKRKYERRI